MTGGVERVPGATERVHADVAGFTGAAVAAVEVQRVPGVSELARAAWQLGRRQKRATADNS